MSAFKYMLTLSVRTSVLHKNVYRQISSCIFSMNKYAVLSPELKRTGPLCTCPVYSNVHTDIKTSPLETDGLWSKLKKKLGFRGKKLKYSKKNLSVTGTKMYLWYSKQIDPVEIMKELELPDTFNSWFLVTELHIWILMFKLVSLEEEGRYIRNGLVQSLWSDVEVRSKSLKGLGLSSKRKEALNHFSDHLLMAIISYDEGILGHDRDLASAIWRILFESHEVDPEKLARVVEYVRKQIKHLDEQDSDVIMAAGMVQLIPFFPDRLPLDLNNLFSSRTLKK